MEWDANDERERIQEIENDPRVNLKVPMKLVDPDPLVVDAKRSLTKPNDRSNWLLKSEGVVLNAGA